MNIYKLTQEYNNDYNTYDSLIVSAENEDDARLITPKQVKGYYNDSVWVPDVMLYEWVNVEYLGTYHKNVSEVILSSYNAG